jgi:hypothetical protein
MLYLFIFVLLLVYAFGKWIVLRLSPFILAGAGVWVIVYIDRENGAMLLLCAGLLMLALDRIGGRRIDSWNYPRQRAGVNPVENPDKDAGLL